LIAALEEPRVLDVGVGSGAIALAIADEHPGARVTGVDTSHEALELAHVNAKRANLDVELRYGDASVAAEGWDLVVANPPYVAQAAFANLQPEVLREPRGALLDTGLHEEIVRASRTTWLVLEVGLGRAATVRDLFAEHGYDDTRITRDLAGIERVVEGRSAERR
jgi:release factor glutamine methyltransferase